jgi:hypothetical protein
MAATAPMAVISRDMMMARIVTSSQSVCRCGE